MHLLGKPYDGLALLVDVFGCSTGSICCIAVLRTTESSACSCNICSSNQMLVRPCSNCLEYFNLLLVFIAFLLNCILGPYQNFGLTSVRKMGLLQLNLE